MPALSQSNSPLDQEPVHGTFLGSSSDDLRVSAAYKDGYLAIAGVTGLDVPIISQLPVGTNQTQNVWVSVLELEPGKESNEMSCHTNNDVATAAPVTTGLGRSASSSFGDTSDMSRHVTTTGTTGVVDSFIGEANITFNGTDHNCTLCGERS